VSPIVRVATAADAEDVARLLVGFRDWYRSDWPDEASFLRSVRRLIDDPDTEFLLGVPEGGAPAAVAQLRYRWSAWSEADDCWIEDLYVEEQSRGSGLGRAMVEAAIDRARLRGCVRIELDVDNENTPARSLYEQLGFNHKHGGAAYMVRRVTG
jgi:GNAT superfamily N-acetyltransferase